MTFKQHVRKQLALTKKCKNGKCLILKGGYYYRDNMAGYTEHEIYAGIYDVNQAYSHVIGCSPSDYITIIPIVTEKHNAKIIEHIKLLSTHLI